MKKLKLNWKEKRHDTEELLTGEQVWELMHKMYFGSLSERTMGLYIDDGYGSMSRCKYEDLMVLSAYPEDFLVDDEDNIYIVIKNHSEERLTACGMDFESIEVDKDNVSKFTFVPRADFLVGYNIVDRIRDKRIELEGLDDLDDRYWCDLTDEDFNKVITELQSR